MALPLEPVESLVAIASSAPLGSNWSAETSWNLAEPIGSSDHLPIVIEMNHKIRYRPVISIAAR